VVEVQAMHPQNINSFGNYFTQFFQTQEENKGKVLLTGIFTSSDLKLILSGCSRVMNERG